MIEYDIYLNDNGTPVKPKIDRRVEALENLVATGSTMPRSPQDRAADVVNVKDFGALGDGVTDATEAFERALASGRLVEVPAGLYRVHTTELSFATIQGEGLIWNGATGLIFRASGADILDLEAHEELAGYLKTESTGTGSAAGTPIFSRSNTRAQQGGVLFTTADGVTHYIVAFRTANSDDAINAGNACRLCEFRFHDGTLESEHIQFTEELPIGHGQGLGVTIEDGEVYLWGNEPYDTRRVNYKGVSKIHWRGASTTSADVERIVLVEDDSPIELEAPTVSADGKYLICNSHAGEVFHIIGWRMESLEAYAEPEINFDVYSLDGYSYLQGICADHKYIYAVAGSGSLVHPRAVLVYDYNGNHIKTVHISTDTYSFGGWQGVITRTTNLISNNELEHIALLGGDLFIGGISSQRDYGAIVTDGLGANYAAVLNTATAPDNSLSVAGEWLSSDYWQPTLLPATHGEFNASTSYPVGAITNRHKYLYRLGRASQHSHLATDDCGSPKPAVNEYKNHIIQIPEHGGVVVQQVNPATRRVRPLVLVNNRGNVYLYDTDAGATSAPSLIYTSKRGGELGIRYNAGSGNASGGNIVLYEHDDTKNRIRASLGIDTEHHVGVTKDGILEICTAPSYNRTGWTTPGIRFVRGGIEADNDGTFATNIAGDIGASTNYLVVASRNRNLAFSSNLVGGESFGVQLCADGTTVGNQSSIASFRPSVSNKGALGYSNALWTQLYAATATISTSDARQKTAVTDPDEAIMRAWAKVDFKAFQFVDAVEKKGEDARIHFGVIAQQVAEAFASEGLDASRYALFCYDKWDDEYEDIDVVDVEAVLDELGNIVTPAVMRTEKRLVLSAGDRYGIRYSEALALECAYQRWRLSKLEEKMASIS